MKRLTVSLAAISVAVAAVALAAQQRDAEMDKLIEQYQAAWNKGDVKSLAALYAEDAIRLGGDTQPVRGRQAIQQMFEKQFASEWKGTKVSITPGRTQSVSADVRLQEGTFELTGGTEGPQRGRYLNTLVRQGGQWRIAGLAAIPQMPVK